MSNRPQPPDDPIIGFEETVSGSTAPGAAGPPQAARRTQVIEPYIGDDDLEPYYEEYANESPAQSPWFYAFLALAALIGAVVVFAIVRSVDRGGDDETPTAIVSQVLQLQLVSPRNGDRVVAGVETIFAANVAASEPIDRVELVLDDEVYAEGRATLAQQQPQAGSTPTGSARLYDGIVRASFTERGEHKVVIRVTSGDLTRDTGAIRIIVVEAPEDPRVEGRIITTTAIRNGPGDQFPEVGQLQSGAEVRIAAKTRDEQWLLLDDANTGERWVRRNAVQLDSSLVNVPIREVSTTPPAATPTPGSEDTPTPGSLGEPDFVPSDARFVIAGGGRAALRVGILNQGADYSGPVVVEAVMSNGSLVSTQLVFDLTLRSGRAATVDFEVSGPLPQSTDVSVFVDPSNAIREESEDNNGATFPGVSAPSDPPEIVIASISPSGSQVTVVVTNLGGALPTSEITVRMNLGGFQTSSSAVAAMDTDDTLTFTLTAEGTGTGTVQVLINGATAASGTVEVSQGGGETPTVEPTETATATATATEEEE